MVLPTSKTRSHLYQTSWNLWLNPTLFILCSAVPVSSSSPSLLCSVFHSEPQPKPEKNPAGNLSTVLDFLPMGVLRKRPNTRNFYCYILSLGCTLFNSKEALCFLLAKPSISDSLSLSPSLPPTSLLTRRQGRRFTGSKDEEDRLFFLSEESLTAK